MIIVEGPDGAGMTTLIDRLCRDLFLTRAPRASSSEGGPVENLAQWASEDVRSWPDRPLQIYDRHPFISESIYGPLVRGSVSPEMHAHFHGSADYRRFLRGARVIFCLPPRHTVAANVENEGVPQMPGVVENIGAIWDQYLKKYFELKQFHYLAGSPEPRIHDYTNPNSYLAIYMAVVKYRKER